MSSFLVFTGIVSLLGPESNKGHYRDYDVPEGSPQHPTGSYRYFIIIIICRRSDRQDS